MSSGTDVKLGVRERPRLRIRATPAVLRGDRDR